MGIFGFMARAKQCKSPRTRLAHALDQSEITRALRGGGGGGGWKGEGVEKAGQDLEHEHDHIFREPTRAHTLEPF